MLLRGALAIFLTVLSLLAQGPEADTGEVTGFAGTTAGSLGGHSVVGATFGAATTKHIVALLDIAFIPLDSDTFQLRGAAVATRKSRLYDFGGAVHIRIPVRERIVPYGIVGAGLLHSTFETFGTRLGEAFNNSQSGNDFAFHTGGGVRWYLGDRWGVRPEWKIYIGDRVFSRLTAGVFFQFP